MFSFAFFASNQVNTLADTGPDSLREVIANARYGATIRFQSDLSDKAIRLNSEIAFTKALTTYIW